MARGAIEDLKTSGKVAAVDQCKRWEKPKMVLRHLRPASSDAVQCDLQIFLTKPLKISYFPLLVEHMGILHDK